mmetsp:Transcript_16136/g.34629  ORF Transcript_16136/g.34629 Transcript_16136/m.34629 type:complete len:249 (-) Transcript_16136:814-1560(-)
MLRRRGRRCASQRHTHRPLLPGLAQASAAALLHAQQCPRWPPMTSLRDTHQRLSSCSQGRVRRPSAWALKLRRPCLRRLSSTPRRVRSLGMTFWPSAPAPRRSSTRRLSRSRRSSSLPWRLSRSCAPRETRVSPPSRLPTLRAASRSASTRRSLSPAPSLSRTASASPRRGARRCRRRARRRSRAWSRSSGSTRRRSLRSARRRAKPRASRSRSPTSSAPAITPAPAPWRPSTQSARRQSQNSRRAWQ